MPDSSSQHSPEAEDLFLEFARGNATSEAFEALCRANATHENALRAMKARWDAIEPNRVAETTPLADRLREKFGDSVDLGVSISEDEKKSAGKQSKLVEQLRKSGPSGARYRLLGEVARGGMGAILKIWDDDLRRALAMKVVLCKDDSSTGETPSIDPKTLGRFLEEAQITGQLEHPGIVPVHELGLDAAGRVYFTMRLVRGEDLRRIFEHVRDGTDGWNPTRALGVMLKVCEAVSYAHSKGVIHRDLKPGNVMVGKFGEVYVMDWGLARVHGREDKHDLRIRSLAPSTMSQIRTEGRELAGEASDAPLITMDGDVVGTPSYMPPEQAMGQLAALGPHSDVYSIGAMLYQLVSGEMPYVPRNAHFSAHMIVASVLHGPPRAVHELAPQTPPELIAIVERAMAREIHDRYPTVQSLADDLRAYVEGRVVRAYETGAWAETRKWVLRNKPLAASLAAALVVAIVGAIAFALKANEATSARDELAGKNVELSTTNSALEKAKSEAIANAESEKRARAEADQKTADVLSLSAQKDLDDLVAKADTLWPAHPRMIAKYEEWLAQANELIDGRSADPAKGIKKRPSLAEHKAKLAELRTKAKALTAEQAKAERDSHPQFKEFEAKQSELTWRSRMLGLEPWPNEADVEAQLEKESLPSDSDALNALAWPLVDPEQLVYGQEVRAMLLARRAVATATEAKRGRVRDSLAWALFKLGRLDEATSEEATAAKEPGGETLEDSVKLLGKRIAAWRGDELAKRKTERDGLAREVADLDRRVAERRTFDYDDPEASWWDRQLSKLVNDLEALRDPNSGLMSNAIAEPFGWGVMKRYEFAKTIEERSVTGADAQKRWAEAIAAIKSSPKYGGLVLKPQIGLLPIGADPDSHLWEFAHLQTGEPPIRGPDGKLELTEGMGLVFVLIPGGKFLMGAQKIDPSGHNYDPQCHSDESPVHEVELSPYFLAKYEMTQSQWQRIDGRNPSYYQPPNNLAPTLLHPVESVSWSECKTLMDRTQLSIPSEAQWENGARAGTETVWWTGQDRELLRGMANLADQTAKRGGASWTDINDWPDLDDGAAAHAEIGRYKPNGFGLHEVAGNVLEWTLDAADAGAYRRAPRRDPVSFSDGSIARVARGGSFLNSAARARSAMRDFETQEIRVNNLGLRPAKLVGD